MFDKIEFLNPDFLDRLILSPFILVWELLRNKMQNPSILWSSSYLIEKKLNWKIILKYALWVTKSIALSAIIIALARPRNVAVSTKIKANKGIDIVMAIDVSASMLAKDLKPNRLEALKVVATDFVNRRPNDRIGIVVYAGESFTQTPITSDKRITKRTISEIKWGQLDGGTAIGMGLATAINRLRESEAPSKVIILLTDGVNTHGKIHPLNATEIAKEFNIRVYTIGVGTNGKAKTPVAIDPFSGKYIYDLVDVEIDEKTLKTIALETGGKYFRATDNNKLKEVYKEINELEKAKIKTIEYDIDLPEKANVFIVFGLFFLLLEFLISKYFMPSIS